MRQDARTTAEHYINEYYPSADCAILSGSVIQGKATPKSDLDLFICCDDPEAPYRKSLTYHEWPMELFVHNPESYPHFFLMDALEGRATLPRMLSDGMVIKDKGTADRIVKQAKEIMERGPARWTEKEVATKRYFLTDLLDDFEGCDNREEGIFIAGELAEAAHEFLLRMNGCWIGRSKWIMRALQRLDPSTAKELAGALNHYYLHDEKALLINYVDQLLECYGGRFFDGFYLK